MEDETPEFIRKIEKFTNYLCAPLIRYVKQNNKHPRIPKDNRSIFSTFLLFFTIIESLTLIIITILNIFNLDIFDSFNLSEFFSQEYYLAIKTYYMPLNILSILQQYVNLTFAYYFDITLKNFIKYIIRQILESILIAVFIPILPIIFFYFIYRICFHNPIILYSKEYLRVYGPLDITQIIIVNNNIIQYHNKMNQF